MESSAKKKEFITMCVKSAAATVIITLALVLLFALILSVTGLTDKAIRPVNQFIKLISVFGGAMLFIRGDKGFLKGALSGFIGSVLSALIFGLVAGGVTSVLALIIDLVCGAVMGAISGAISVNITK